MDRLAGFLERQHAFILLTTLLVAILGLYGVLHMPRTAWPEQPVTAAIIEVHYPAATAQQIEALIIQPIEEALEGVGDIGTIVASAFPELAYMVVRIDRGAPNRLRVVSDIQQAIDRLTDLPDLRHAPLVREWRDAPPHLLVAVRGGDAMQREVSGRALFAALRSQDGVALITRHGWGDRQIAVVVNPEAMTHYQVTIPQVATTLVSRNVNLPGGRLIDAEKQREYLLRIAGHMTTPEEIADLVIRANDRAIAVRLGAIADVHWEVESARTQAWVRGEPATIFAIHRQPGFDGVHLSRALHQRVAAFEISEAPITLEILEDHGALLQPTRVWMYWVIGLLTGLVSVVLLLKSGWRATVLFFFNYVLIQNLALTIAAWCGISLNAVTLLTALPLVVVLQGVLLQGILSPRAVSVLQLFALWGALGIVGLMFLIHPDMSVDTLRQIPTLIAAVGCVALGDVLFLLPVHRRVLNMQDSATALAWPMSTMRLFLTAGVVAAGLIVVVVPRLETTHAPFVVDMYTQDPTRVAKWATQWGEELAWIREGVHGRVVDGPASSFGPHRVSLRFRAMGRSAQRKIMEALHAETDALFEPIAAHSHSEVRLMLREGTAESAGLTWHAMARSVRAALVGEASTIVRHRDGEFSVVVKYPADRLTALRDLGVVVLENAQRHLTPLDRVVTTEQGVGLREIVRVNRRRRDSPLVQRASPTGISSLLGLLALGFLTGGAILVTLRERA